MLESVSIGVKYRSAGGWLFEVLDIVRHAQDCSIAMVVYIALEPTFDSPAGSKWVLEESIFLKRFTEYEETKK